jgi:hypothetical protein
VNGYACDCVDDSTAGSPVAAADAFKDENAARLCTHDLNAVAGVRLRSIVGAKFVGAIESMAPLSTRLVVRLPVPAVSI